MVSVTDHYGHILEFLDRTLYFFFWAAPQLYSWGWGAPFQAHYFSANLVLPAIKPWPLGHRGGLPSQNRRNFRSFDLMDKKYLQQPLLLNMLHLSPSHIIPCCNGVNTGTHRQTISFKGTILLMDMLFIGQKCNSEVLYNFENSHWQNRCQRQEMLEILSCDGMSIWGLDRNRIYCWIPQCT
jgi:hypothetical protein